MKQYQVMTCLRCNHSFKSKVDSIHVRCSECGSVKVVPALEMPPRISTDIEITKLREMFETQSNELGELREIVEHMRPRLNDTIKYLNDSADDKKRRAQPTQQGRARC